MLKLYDHDAVGGPIMKDRLWFYSIVRYLGNCAIRAGDVRQRQRGQSKRLTRARHHVAGPQRFVEPDGQHAHHVPVSQRNKLNLFWDEQRGCNGSA